MKQKDEFEKMLDDELYQVFLFASPAHIPFSIFTHPWVVINKKGHLARYEVRHKLNKARPELGHLHVDDLHPFVGIPVLSFHDHAHWNPTLLGQIEGGEDSPAQKMCEFIESSTETYKNKNKYFFLGPNSNTYAQWILDNSPEFKGKLRWNALGAR